MFSQFLLVVKIAAIDPVVSNLIDEFDRNAFTGAPLRSPFGLTRSHWALGAGRYWALATRLGTDRWRLATRLCKTGDWRLATGDWRLGSGNHQSKFNKTVALRPTATSSHESLSHKFIMATLPRTAWSPLTVFPLSDKRKRLRASANLPYADAFLKEILSRKRDV